MGSRVDFALTLMRRKTLTYRALAVVSAAILAAILLSVGETKSAQAAFPGANGKIVFAKSLLAQGSQNDIYAMNPDSSNLTNLTNNPAQDGQPAVSPDGTKIAFASDRDTGARPDVYVMNADGSNQRRLTNNPAEDKQPAWSPDGKKILFVSLRDGNQELYVMDADGNNQKRLTRTPAFEYYPAWSPDGTKIAYARYVSTTTGMGRLQLFTMNADGTKQTRITNNSFDDYYANWSPDGKKIAFTQDAGNSSPGQPKLYENDSEVYVINSDGSNNPVRLTNNSAIDERPNFSPDGTKIAFDSTRDGNYEVYEMNPDGTNPTNITNDPANDDYDSDWGVAPTR